MTKDTSPNKTPNSPETTGVNSGSTSNEAGESQNQFPAEENSDTTESIRELVLEDDESTTLIKNRRLLDPTEIVDENRIVGRNDQLKSIAQQLKLVVNNDPPRNLYLYGPSGTGKSLILNAVCENIQDLCRERGTDFGVVNLNCQSVETLGIAVYELLLEISKETGDEIQVPEHGVSTKKKWRELYRMLDDNYDSVVFVMDELDLLVGRRDKEEPAFSRLLYQLSRTGSSTGVSCDVSVCAITNDTTMLEDVGSRALSTFNPEEIHFSDYNAGQIRKILHNRKDAFEKGALSEDVIPLTAALSAQTHGDARKAIDLIRTAGSIAEQNSDSQIDEEHVRKAQEKVEKNRVLEVTRGITSQKKLCLFATAAVAAKGSEGAAASKQGYKVYQYITQTIDANQYLQETYVNKMKELTTYSLVEFSRESAGPSSGSYLEFRFGEAPQRILETLREDSRFDDVDEQQLDIFISGQLG